MSLILRHREGSALVVVACLGCGVEIETLPNLDDRCTPCWSKKRIDELVTEGERQRAVMVHALLDITSWEEGVAVGAWSTLLTIKERLVAELERPPADVAPPPPAAQGGS